MALTLDRDDSLGVSAPTSLPVIGIAMKSSISIVSPGNVGGVCATTRTVQRAATIRSAVSDTRNRLIGFRGSIDDCTGRLDLPACRTFCFGAPFLLRMLAGGFLGRKC